MNAIADMMRDVTPREVVTTALDIFIVYYVIYRVLLTIKGTRAAQMVIGIVLIGAGFFVAERLQMTTVSWLLDNFISYFIIIVIVVFQQDIRRGLMRLGQKVGPFGRTHAVTQALDEVLSACDQLAKARIGAIVVFEREAELVDFFDHGKVVDAKVSQELLAALFVPSRDNKLHDGAVVIDKELRIRAAGVVLPLSRSDLPEEFGTRHRAALGITEETDAVAIVVSEERGEVSLCYRGNIARDMEIPTLRGALQGLFEGEKEGAQIADEAQAAADIAKGLAALAAERPEPVDSETTGPTRTASARAGTPRPVEGGSS